MTPILRKLLEEGYVNTGNIQENYLALMKDRHEILYNPDNDIVLSPACTDPNSPAYRSPCEMTRTG